MKELSARDKEDLKNAYFATHTLVKICEHQKSCKSCPLFIEDSNYICPSVDASCHAAYLWDAIKNSGINLNEIPVEKRTGWIKIENALPDYTTNYVIYAAEGKTADGNEYRKIGVGCYSWGLGAWLDNGRFIEVLLPENTSCHVYAWMHLPEMPYNR